MNVNGLWLGEKREHDILLYGTISRGDFYLCVIKSPLAIKEVFQKSPAVSIAEELVKALKRNVERMRWMSSTHALYRVRVLKQGCVMELIESSSLECEIRTEEGEVLYSEKEKQELRKPLDLLKEIEELKDQNQKVDKVRAILEWIRQKCECF